MKQQYKLANRYKYSIKEQQLAKANNSRKSG